MYRISVVIPTYNRSALVSQAIQSVLAQTYKAHEIIVVDDGSTDDTELQLSKCGDVRYIRQQNAGASAARNLGIDSATGDWIALLDSDDLWAPLKLKKQVDRLREVPDAEVCYCDYRYTDLQGRVVDDSHFRMPPVGESMIGQFLQGCPVPTPTVVAKKTCFDHGLRFDVKLKYGEDWLVYATLANCRKFVAVPEPLVDIRKHPGNVTANAIAALSRDHIEVIHRIFELNAAAPFRYMKRRVIATTLLSAASASLREGELGHARRFAWAAVRWRALDQRCWRILLRSYFPKRRQSVRSVKLSKRLRSGHDSW